MRICAWLDAAVIVIVRRLTGRFPLRQLQLKILQNVARGLIVRFLIQLVELLFQGSGSFLELLSLQLKFRFARWALLRR
jgi:hypothetical protein